MEQNSSKLIKSYLLPACLLFITTLLFIPTILNASKNADGATATPKYLEFLPIIFKGGGSTIGGTPSPTPCKVQFEGYALANTTHIYVTGDIGTTVTVLNLTTGNELVSGTLQSKEGHSCPGFADLSAPTSLVPGHVVLVESSDTTIDSTTVLIEEPTPTTTAPLSTATATATATPTTISDAADLIIGKPQLISTPPIAPHEQVNFTVIITNAGTVDVNQQFFVDIFLDPQNVTSHHIPLDESSGYIAVGSLSAGQSRQLTISAPSGFNETPNPHHVYAMVDSVEQVVEQSENNNISTNLITIDSAPVTPTFTPTPDGINQISGIVRGLYLGEWIPKHRAVVRLVHPILGVIAIEESDVNGFYNFDNIPAILPEQFTITACYQSNSGPYFGVRNNVQVPNAYANIYMLPGSCSYEYPITPTPIIPTMTATHTATPYPTNTSTPTAYPTSTGTPTSTATVVLCHVQFEGFVIEGTYSVYVTGDIGTTVTIIRNGQVLGTATLLERDEHTCEGFAEIPLNAAVFQGDFLIAESNDGSVDFTAVLAAVPTPTHTPTYTPVPTNTPTHIPTPTPSYAYIALFPNCGTGPNMEITVVGYNWDNDESIAFYWEGNPEVFTTIPEGHGGGFAFTATFTKPDGTHTMRAESSGSGAEKDISTANFYVPCSGTESPTTTPTVTSTPIPADLIIGQPQLISTPPIVLHEPLDFSVIITNVGEVDIDKQFFVDIYLDPQTIYTDRIPLDESSGYIAVSALAGGQSKQLTIQTHLGLLNTPDPHSVYGMVDSAQQVIEASEINNISSALTIVEVTPAYPPTTTPTPDGTSEISGIIRILDGVWHPQYRTEVKLIHPVWGIIATTEADQNGMYTFMNIPPLVDPDRYTVTACFPTDSGPYFGTRNSIQAPYPYTNIYLLSGPCS